MVRAERRDEATADRLLDEVASTFFEGRSGALPDLLVVDLTDWAPGEIVEEYGR